MGKQASLLMAETEALRDTYAALNRGDIPDFVRIFDPRIERIEFPDSPQGGTYLGIEAVTEHINKGRETWAEGSCEPEQFLVAGDRIVVFVHVHVRLKQETEWREGRTADVFTFCNGKAIQWHTFADKRQAVEYAGAIASDVI